MYQFAALSYINSIRPGRGRVGWGGGGWERGGAESAEVISTFENFLAI